MALQQLRLHMGTTCREGRTKRAPKGAGTMRTLTAGGVEWGGKAQGCMCGKGRVPRLGCMNADAGFNRRHRYDAPLHIIKIRHHEDPAINRVRMYMMEAYVHAENLKIP